MFITMYMICIGCAHVKVCASQLGTYFQEGKVIFIVSSVQPSVYCIINLLSF